LPFAIGIASLLSERLRFGSRWPPLAEISAR
jgi:hypothetical protein